MLKVVPCGQHLAVPSTVPLVPRLSCLHHLADGKQTIPFLTHGPKVTASLPSTCPCRRFTASHHPKSRAMPPSRAF